MKASCNGLKRGHVLICRQSAGPMQFDQAGTKIEAGTRIVGQALCLSRDLDRVEVAE